MAKFDINKYKEVNDKEVDMKKTKHNLGIFLNAYFKARERVGMPREPKVTATLSDIPVSSGRISKKQRIFLFTMSRQKKNF